MTTFDGSDMVLLMLTGLTVVIIALRAIARANRIKRQALADEAADATRRSRVAMRRAK
jgi:hypothetical protein